MTAIIGRHCPVRGEIVIAADSRTSWASTFIDDSETTLKIIRGDNWAIGISGPCRVSQLLSRAFPEIDSPLRRGDIGGFMNIYKQIIIGDDFISDEEDGPGSRGYAHNGLCATGGSLYFVGPDFAASLVPPGKVFGAGAASAFVVGAATALLLGHLSKKPKTWAIPAIEIAVANNHSCGLPVQLVVVPAEKALS